VPEDISTELHHGLSRGPTLEFLRKAYRMLPELDRPRILDVGCGEGIPTLELAKLSGGEVVGVDIDRASLDKLSARIDGAGLGDRVRVVHASMLETDFPDESFDIVWAEGSIQFVGFETALDAWRRLIKPGRFLVVHEMAWLRPDPPQEIVDRWQPTFPEIRTVEEYVEQLPCHGYEPVGHFSLPEEAWWLEHYGPVEGRIRELRVKYRGDAKAQSVLDAEQREVDLYKRNAAWYGSAYLVMRKRT